MNMFKEYLELIKNLDYVVQRNWEELPAGDPNHPDLDIFVSKKDYPIAKRLADMYEFIDVRTEGDGYYSPVIEEMLLDNKVRIEIDGVEVKIPDQFAFFIALYYHNLVHKKDNPYKEKLGKLFLDMYPPVKPDDEGVGYYVS